MRLNEVDVERFVYDIINSSNELKQGLYFCALCSKSKKVEGKDVIISGFPTCCDKKMNIVQVHGTENAMSYSNFWYKRRKKK